MNKESNYRLKARTSRLARLFRYPMSELSVDENGISVLREGHNATTSYARIESLDVGPGWLWKTVRLKEVDNETAEIRGIGSRDARIVAVAARACGAGGRVAALLDQFDRPDGKIQYLTSVRLNDWLPAAVQLSQSIGAPADVLLPSPIRHDIDRLQRIIADPEAARAERNAGYVAQELDARARWFDAGQQYPLTTVQRDAIVHDESRCLVVAGAGTGKTSTIIGKAGQLVKAGLAAPEEVLLLAYTRKACEEMQARFTDLGLPNVTIRTFHSLGMTILGSADLRKPSVSKLADDNGRALLRLIREYVNRLVCAEPDGPVAQFVAYYRYPYQSSEHFASEHEHMQYLKRQHLRSLQGIKMKSQEECRIADWLTLHGVRYEYERKYDHDVASVQYRQYQPDFYLPDYKIYIEHFALGADKQPPQFIRDKDKYLEGIRWKRALHLVKGTRLIETYSYQMRDGSLFFELRRNLESAGVELRTLSRTEIADLLAKKELIDPLASLMKTFLLLFKGNNWTRDDLEARAQAHGDRPRALLFCQLFEGVLGHYKQTLKASGDIDFSDMINDAVDRVSTNKYRSPFKYILVDEFQDTDRSRARLLVSLLNQVYDSRLFCVGDDWQSIYRFTGSDVGLMLDFEHCFGNTRRVLLGDTYRFSKELADLSSRFIMSNPRQGKKELQATTSVTRTMVVVTRDNDEHWHDVARRLIKEILVEDSSERISILLLGRYHHCLKKMKSFRGPRLEVNCMTVHQAKGLEADYTIVVDITSGRYGFPSEVEDDPLLELVLSKRDDFPNAEERRVFYVAMTRSRMRTYLVTDRSSASCFIDELERYDCPGLIVASEKGSQTAACPDCGGAPVREIEDAIGSFWGCINHPYCDWTAQRCPKCKKRAFVRDRGQFRCLNSTCGNTAPACPACGVGVLERKLGTNRAFLGCSEWRREGASCNYTCDAPPKPRVTSR